MRTALENAMAELVTQGWTLESAGTVDDPSGYLAIVEWSAGDAANADVTEPDERAALAALEVGHYFYRQDENGLVWVIGPMSLSKARCLVTEYMERNGSDEDDQED